MIILRSLTAPFLLNDFANIYVADYRLWLAIDYVAVKAFPLGFISYLLRTKKLSCADLGASTASIMHTVGTNSQKFYRVVQLD